MRKDFYKMVRKIFNTDASVAIESCRRFPMWDKIALKDDPVALKRFVKKDCITQAKNELEAYRAQKQMLEYMGEPVGKIGAAVAIYEALSEAFENS